MIVMVSNLSGAVFHYLAGKHPGKVGQLYSPEGYRQPFPWMPYALDNGCYTNWDEPAFLKTLDKARNCGIRPLWVLVPDVVSDKSATLSRWKEWSPRLREYGWPLAFAGQDGMTPSDVPDDAEVVFMGGSIEWKHRNLERFCAAFPRIHVGRVNTERVLWLCHDFGVESVDGTGWWHRKQTQQLANYLEASTNDTRHEQLDLCEYPVSERNA